MKKAVACICALTMMLSSAGVVADAGYELSTSASGGDHTITIVEGGQAENPSNIQSMEDLEAALGMSLAEYNQKLDALVQEYESIHNVERQDEIYAELLAMEEKMDSIMGDTGRMNAKIEKIARSREITLSKAVYGFQSLIQSIGLTGAGEVKTSPETGETYISDGNYATERQQQLLKQYLEVICEQYDKLTDEQKSELHLAMPYADGGQAKYIDNYAELKPMIDQIGTKISAWADEKYAWIGADGKTTVFSDLPADHWAYDDVMTMADKGMVSGTTTPVDGVGTYEPDGTVTLGQFLAIATRLVASDKIVAGEYAHWADANYNAAVQAGLISNADFSGAAEALDAPISREDMAYILVNVAKANGEVLNALTGIEHNIADLTAVSPDRADAVKAAYSNGLLTGKGNRAFKPHDSLTRAEVAAVFCRVMNYTARPTVTIGE